MSFWLGIVIGAVVAGIVVYIAVCAIIARGFMR